MEMLKVY